MLPPAAAQDEAAAGQRSLDFVEHQSSASKVLTELTLVPKRAPVSLWRPRVDSPSFSNPRGFAAPARQSRCAGRRLSAEASQSAARRLYPFVDLPPTACRMISSPVSGRRKRSVGIKAEGLPFTCWLRSCRRRCRFSATHGGIARRRAEAAAEERPLPRTVQLRCCRRRRKTNSHLLSGSAAPAGEGRRTTTTGRKTQIRGRRPRRPRRRDPC